jgi:hypothetical protein
MRTLLAGEGEGACSWVDEGVIDSDGNTERTGDCCGIGVGDMVGDSCPSATEDNVAIRSARVALAVMSSEVETSLSFK